MRKRILKISALVLIVTIIGLMVPSFQETKAAPITNAKDTMSRLKVSTTADHTIVFTLPSGVDFDSDDMLKVDFPADFTQAGTWATTDFTFNDGTNRTVATVDTTADNSVTCTDGANNVGIEIDTTNLIFKVIPCGATFTASAAGATVTFTIKGTAGDGTLTNPSSAGSYKIDIANDENKDGTDDDTTSIAVAIVSDEQVAVSATVEPTISFSISSNTCALGTLSTASVSTCQYTLAVGTNAANGAVITIQALSDGTNAHLNKDGDPTVWIDDITNNTQVTAGTEGYGIAVTAGTGWTEVGDFATDDTPIPSTATDILSTSGPISSSVTSTITHKVAISDTTPAGTYSQTVQYVATGTF